MKILIISDTHKNIDKLIEVSEKYKDYIKFDLGDRQLDKEIYEKYGYISVDGNCDLDNDNLIKEEILDNKKFLLTHGHIFNVKYTYLNLYYKALEINANYVLFGHTHFQEVFKKGDITFINPGALKDGHFALIIDGEIKLI